MRESRTFTLMAAWAMIAAIAVMFSGKALAQSYTLEFKGGVAATSTINSSASKSVADSKLGPNVGAGFGYILPGELLRAYGECSYSAKGEKYMLDDGLGEFSSDVSYFQLYPNARFYLPYLPVYAGAGLHFGFATSREVKKGDYLDQSHSWNFIEYYKVFDMGPKVAIGGELGVGNVRLIIEGAYEYGLVNISKREERKIKNQTLCINMGICFMLTNRHFRHY